MLVLPGRNRQFTTDAHIAAQSIDLVLKLEVVRPDPDESDRAPVVGGPAGRARAHSDAAPARVARSAHPQARRRARRSIGVSRSGSAFADSFPPAVAEVVFATLARANHSCAPNCIADGDEGTLRLIRDHSVRRAGRLGFIDIVGFSLCRCRCARRHVN